MSLPIVAVAVFRIFDRGVLCGGGRRPAAGVVRLEDVLLRRRVGALLVTGIPAKPRSFNTGSANWAQKCALLPPNLDLTILRKVSTLHKFIRLRWALNAKIHQQIFLFVLFESASSGFFGSSSMHFTATRTWSVILPTTVHEIGLAQPYCNSEREQHS